VAIQVLVVDDEVDFLNSFVMRLGLRGLEAHGVSTGAAALEYLADHAVDVVVLDVKMPGMDGLETLRQIRRQRPSVQVIVLTGHGSQEFSKIGLELGAFDYLIKPVKLDTVIERILKACPAQGAGDDRSG
jgi:DNA-binding response OmpR family regulator